MDLSNRPCFTHNLSLDRGDGVEKVGDLSLEMFEHALDSLVVNAKVTVHVVELEVGSLEDMVLATAMSFGEALKYCSMVDLRRSGATASSKGTLSV
jgi:imidazoleglycerol-phosphate dehydratase